MRKAIVCLFVMLAVVASATPAQASAVRTGSTLAVIAALTRGSAVAYDSTNKVYLVVSAAGIVRGSFVTADGTPLGAFVIQTSGNYTHFPRVAFSPDAANGTGGFLVTWHESDMAVGTSIHGRMVSRAQNGPSGADTVLAADGSWWEAGAAVAYSAASQEFLVVWQKFIANNIRGVRVTNNGAPKTAPFDVSVSGAYARDPSVAHNPRTDEFMVVNAGAGAAGAYVDSRRVQGGTNTVIGAPVRLVQTGGTYITDVSYNPSTNQYLAAWFSLPADAGFGRILNADGSLGGDVITLSTRWKAYDALSLAYNTRSNTFFMVSHAQSVEDGGVEIATTGIPVDNGFIVTAAGGSGNFYPRLAANTDQPDWLVSASNSFTSTVVQRVAGTVGSGGGSGGGGGGGGPIALTSNPRMNVDGPANNGVVSGGITVGGWAVDLGHPSDVGIAAVHVWAFPTTGAAPIFMGVAALGGGRPDVGGAFAASRFSSSGFSLTAAALPPGVHDIGVYAQSTITGTFNNSQVRRVTVTAPQSIPRMSIDLPAPSQMVSQNFRVAGWALDVGSSSGTGVDAIHVWAYPISGGTPLFVGVASLGHSRPDVATAFGAARYSSGGFNLVVTGAVPPGEYNLVIFAHSAVTGTFNNAAVIRIRVL